FVATCPKCGQEALVFGDGDVGCFVCRSYWGDPTEAAEDYAAYHNPRWKHPKHGIDDRIAWCRQCDLRTLAPAGPDLQNQIDKAVESWAPPNGDEPIGWGDLGDFYICFGCAEPVSESDLVSCSYCGELAPRDG